MAAAIMRGRLARNTHDFATPQSPIGTGGSHARRPGPTPAATCPSREVEVFRSGSGSGLSFGC